MRAKSLTHSKTGFFFVLPYFIVFSVFGFYPILFTLYLSFQSWNGITSVAFVGFRNFSRLFTDPVFYLSLANTMRIWVINYIPQIAIALLLAVMFSTQKIKGMSTFRAIFYLPNLMTSSSIALLFNLFFNGDFSVSNKLLLQLHIISKPINWFQNDVFTSMTVSYIQWWMWFGYSTIIIMAGLTGISTYYYEAAQVDGASGWAAFRFITFPLLKPTVLYLTVTSLIGGLQLFDVPYVLTDGYGAPDKSILTTSIYLYNQAFKYYNYGYAAAVAYGLFLLIALLSVISFRIFKGDGGGDNDELH